LACLLAPWVAHAITTSGFLAHYEAPALGPLLLIACCGLREIRGSGDSGLFLARALPVIAGMTFLAAVCGWPLGVLRSEPPYYSWYAKSAENPYRPAVLHDLESKAGNHLVIVHYSPQHFVIDEWVYNRADLSRARVIWARDMGEERNAELVRAFRGRSVWTIAPDQDPTAVVPYAGAGE
jgi:hypothetical protein